jgi:hypothetical protein
MKNHIIYGLIISVLLYLLYLDYKDVDNSTNNQELIKSLKLEIDSVNSIKDSIILSSNVHKEQSVAIADTIVKVKYRYIKMKGTINEISKTDIRVIDTLVHCTIHRSSSFCGGYIKTLTE